MAFIRDVTVRLWSFISPRKTQRRRDKDFKFKVPPLPNHVRRLHAVDQGELSSEASVQSWTVEAPPQTHQSFDGANLPPSPPTSVERADMEMDGDTLINEVAENLHPVSEAWDANEETILVDDGDYEAQQKAMQKNAELERMRRDIQGCELRAAGWTEDAIFLFQKLGLRGFEPLLPYTWFEDFTMLPADLFTRNMDKAFIKPTSPAGDYHAYRALDNLLGLGGRVRDAVLQKPPIRTAEKLIRAAILKYNKWALKDGNVESLWSDISIFNVVSFPKDVSPEVAEGKMLRRLQKRAEQWRDAFRERRRGEELAQQESPGTTGSIEGPDLPTLYGVLTCHTIMAFVSYDVHAASPQLRTVAMFDLGQEGYDVWNSLAIAIFVIHCRNRLIQLRDSLPQPAVSSPSTDPDA